MKILITCIICIVAVILLRTTSFELCIVWLLSMIVSDMVYKDFKQN